MSCLRGGERAFPEEELSSVSASRKEAGKESGRIEMYVCSECKGQYYVDGSLAFGSSKPTYFYPGGLDTVGALGVGIRICRNCGHIDWKANINDLAEIIRKAEKKSKRTK